MYLDLGTALTNNKNRIVRLLKVFAQSGCRDWGTSVNRRGYYVSSPPITSQYTHIFFDKQI